MIKTEFSGQTLSSLVTAIGFNKTGVPKSAAEFVHRLLSLAPFYENLEEVDALLPREFYYTVLYAFTTHDVIEHGGGVGGSWLTEKGQTLRDELDGIDWTLPYKPTVLEFPSRKFVPRPCDTETLDEEVSHRLDHCGCGSPEEAFEFTAKLLDLAPLTVESAPLAALVPDEGMRQFLIYHMTYLGLVDETTGALTDNGGEILRKMGEIETVADADSDD